MKKPLIVFLHLSYWFVYLLMISVIFLALHSASGEKQLMRMLTGESGIISIVPALATFYLFYFFIYPRYLVKRKTGKLVASGLLTVLGVSAVSTGLLILRLTLRNAVNMAAAELMGSMFVFAALTTIHGVLALVLRGFITSVGDIRLKEELQRKNTEMELAMIRSQLNPHFLFNTLNNIDVLIAREPGKASAYLNKLSDILRFMLYETQGERIPLSAELANIGKYIDLQRIRSANPDYVWFDVKGEADSKDIAPMLLIPLIENAFKHADHRKTGNAVSIRVNAEAGQLIFESENAVSRHPRTPADPGGLGNELIRKRLSLIYPGRHSLEMGRNGDLYHTRLVVKW